MIKNKDIIKNLHIIQPRIKAVQKPSAQYATLCEVGEVAEAEYSRRLMQLIESLPKNSVERSVVELMYDEGLRISDALNIKPSDVNRNGWIEVYQGKGSSSKLVRVRSNYDFWMVTVFNGYEISKDYNRFYFYRLLKERGIQKSVNGCKNKKVTHSLRYEVASNVYSVSNDISDVSKVLGHKNSNSSRYYVRKAKCL